ncbi:MAG: hypothetical protein ACO1RT_02880 [Planctomycetaceae bacterium]
MSTRATIAVRRTDLSFQAVYLHFDGYPEHAGEALAAHFATPALAESLVFGPDLRCIDRDTGAIERYRDSRGPANLPTRDALMVFAQNCSSQYLYVFEAGAWSCEKM